MLGFGFRYTKRSWPLGGRTTQHVEANSPAGALELSMRHQTTRRPPMRHHEKHSDLGVLPVTAGGLDPIQPALIFLGGGVLCVADPTHVATMGGQDGDTRIFELGQWQRHGRVWSALRSAPSGVGSRGRRCRNRVPTWWLENCDRSIHVALPAFCSRQIPRALAHARARRRHESFGDITGGLVPV